MTRSVVFKTPGKLDLRSIMTFGLNAKPATGHPIGFFGTGLKYAIAVLVRNKIPVTFYIDQQKWSIDTEESTFRDKSITEVFLTRHRKLLPPVHRKLPFTTELGKTWQLWQAFRELESNTRDENGETYLMDFAKYKDEQEPLPKHTFIMVEGESFVQEYLDRAKTFLPDGLTLREGDEDIQIFDRPSNCVYYRSIRVLDLNENERGTLTYNILRSIELTEDRTAKSKWDVQYYISQALTQHEDPEIIKKVVQSKHKTFEAGLNYSYGTPSKTFLDTVQELPTNKVEASATQVLKTHRPPKIKAGTTIDWLAPIIEAIDQGNWDDVEPAIQPYRVEFLHILRAAQAQLLKEQANNASPSETDEAQDISPGRVEEVSQGSEFREDDDIPF